HELLRVLRLEGAPRARAFALSLHGALVAFAIDGQASLRGEVLHEVERHTERVVQAKRFVARNDLRTSRRAIEHLFESRQTGGQNRIEPLLPAADDLDDSRTSAAQPRIRRP